MNSMHGGVRSFVVCMLGSLLLACAACGPMRRGPAVPLELTEQATVLGNPAVRSFAGNMNKEFLDELLRASQVEIDADRAAAGTLTPVSFLAISGGGSNGAYGAGVLCGWTKMGTRPKFKLVTGISTGALTAPFAFLGGQKYDDKLKYLYTNVTTKQICFSRGILSALSEDALMDTKPLRGLIAEVVDDEMLRAIAAEYAKGRILLVGTTNLDACRGVIWNIGLMATIGGQESYDMIRAVLLASAAIPAAFPPVMLDVTIDNKQYQEMHVDGGAVAQVFLYPASFTLDATARKAGVVRERSAYIIRNARLRGRYVSVDRLVMPIAGRAIGSLIDTQGIGDLFRIFLTTRRDGVDFNLAYIPDDFAAIPAEEFDPVYMTKLFDLGYAKTTEKGGYPWIKYMPGFEDVTSAELLKEPSKSGQ